MNNNLRARFMAMTADLKTDWEAYSKDIPRMSSISEEQRLKQEMLMDQGLQKAYQFLNQYHKIPRRSWQKQRDKLIQSLLDNDTLLVTSHMDHQIKNQLLQVSIAFIRAAREFDPLLSLSDIGQAMRNVWICAVLQLLFCKEVRYSKAIFGYSMLYPYTDNLLDDEMLTQADKQSFNRHFYARLKGEKICAVNEYEQKVFRLIGAIESVYDRNQYPDVYESLYLIMEGQIQSLTQQTDSMSHSELLRISIEKGAASVVADGYLVCGDMDQKQLRFCMQYGFMLQLGDDLQDIEEDHQHHHQTLYSMLDENVLLDQPICQLLSYTEQLMNDVTCDAGTKTMVIDNCMLLIYLSVLSKPHRFSSAFIKRCEQAMPLHYAYLQKIGHVWSNSELGKRASQDESYLKELLDAVLE